MKKLYESPELELINLTAKARIARDEDRRTVKSEEGSGTITGSEVLEEWD